MKTDNTDFLIIGGGIIGVNLALRIRHRYPDSTVTIIEKEQDCGLHASGRNSGVLHAGFYYTADSLKAKFSRDGNRLLTEYCLSRKLRINRCGKIVVAKNAGELETLEELLRRGQHNGVELHKITAAEAKAIEPRVITYEQALFSPTTSSVDPGEVLGAMLEDARTSGVRVYNDTVYLSASSNRVRTSRGQIEAGYIINAAGLYADKIARDFGFSTHYRIIPFKGLYLIGDEPEGALKTNVYPVPDLANPFLGVHFTITADGHIKVGPTAIPAFWREHYQGLQNFKLAELVEVTFRELTLLINNDLNFRKLAVQEIRKYMKSRMAKLAAELVTDISPSLYTRWGKPGIRAQLYDTATRRLEMDFKFEGDSRSFHVLNAVSPAFTCAIPFSEFLVDKIENLLSGDSTTISRKYARP
jgi:L-2-hydroxyglutarate oxidase LhgO